MKIFRHIQYIEMNIDNIREEEDIFKFINVTEKNGTQKITIIIEEHLKLMLKMGFFCYDIDKNNDVFLKIKNNIASEVSRKYIIRTYRSFIKSLPSEIQLGDPEYDFFYTIKQSQLLQRIDVNMSNLFSKDLLKQLISEQSPSFNTDTKHECYAYFYNKYIKITARKLEAIEYKNLEHIIYDYEIINRHFIQVDYKGVFYQFIQNVVGNSKGQKPKRFLALCTMLGYILHKTNEGKRKALILTDGRMSDEADGRSGKGIICKSIGHFLNRSKDESLYVNIPGKDFNAKDNTRYARCSTNTKVIHLDDVERNFDLDILFNDIDESVKVKRLYAEPFYISPKFIVSTNKTIRTPGGSARDRVMEFELADYYSENFSPEDEFGMWFFREWKKEEWLKFDNFMVFCIQSYLKNGIIKAESINLEARKLREETSIEFVDFMELFTAGEIDLNEKKYKSKECRFAWYEKMDKALLLDAFTRRHEDFRKVRENKKTRFNWRFTKWLKNWALYHRDFVSIGPGDEPKSGSTYFIIFKKSQAKINDEKNGVENIISQEDPQDGLLY